MDALQSFHFIRPLWFFAIIPCALLFFYLLNHYRRASQWKNFIDPNLLPFLIEGQFSKQAKTPAVVLFLLAIILIVAAAGPTWEKKPIPIQQDNSALVILWDLSPSMYAEDIKPSRLVRARLKLIDLLNTRKEGLTALIAYAGDAHVVTPLTDDTRTIKSLLPGLSPAVMPEVGNNPERATELAIALLNDTGVAKGNIVFVTDDIPYSAHTTLNSVISSTQHRVTVWGIGTQAGGPIPLPDSGFIKNRNGEIVIAKVDHATLSDAATRMGGTYIPFSSDDSDIESILYFGFDEGKSESERKIDTSDEWSETGHWLVLICLPFLALMFRRGWLLSLTLCFFLPPQNAYAFEWQDLWKRQDQQAYELLEQAESGKAAETFNDPDWKAIADYKSGQFDKAIEQFAKHDDVHGHFNLGNALTHKGEYDAAIAAYDRALQLTPGMEAATQNRAIAEQLKKMQEQQSQQNQNQQEGDNQQQGDNQQNNDQEYQNSDSSSQTSSENNQGEQSQQDQQNTENNAQQENQQSSAEQGDSQSSEQKQSGDHQGENNTQSQNTQAQQSDEEKQKQQEALDNHYKSQETPPEGEQDSQQAQASAAEKMDQDKHADAEENAQAAIARTQLSEEEMEQQQALDQWLRRVPDDPSGLLRNKFRYEYNKRRRESFDRPIRSPEGPSDEERW